MNTRTPARTLTITLPLPPRALGGRFGSLLFEPLPDQVAGGQVTLRGFNANLAPQLRADAEGKAFLVHDTNGSIDAAALDDTIDTNGVQWRHHTVGYRAMVEARSWTPEDDAILREMYESDTRRQIGERLGRTLASVRSRCLRLGLNTKAPASWTSEQVHQLCDWYAERAGLYTDIRVLAERLGRSYMAVALKANELGFGDFRRKSPLPPKPRVQSWKTKYPTLAEARAARIAAKKAWYLTHEHPRGALGMKHSDEARRKMGSASKRTADARTQAQRTAIARKGIATKMSRYGTGSPGTHAGNAYSRAKRGKRDDLGGQFFRSRWEANYARFLRFLLDRGDIKAWEYEPETFIFHGVTRGVLTYLPDFRVTENDGRIVYHEVKGWMDAKSKAKIKSMAKFYPDVALIVIGESEYRALAKWSRLIEGWEDDRG